MRGGILLAEENPQQLMTRNESRNLEEIFFNLSVQQNTVSTTQVKVADYCKKKKNLKLTILPLHRNLEMQLSPKNYLWVFSGLKECFGVW